MRVNIYLLGNFSDVNQKFSQSTSVFFNSTLVKYDLTNMPIIIEIKAILAYSF